MGTIGSGGGNTVRIWAGNVKTHVDVGDATGIVVPTGKFLSMDGVTFGDGGTGNFYGFDI